MGVLWGLKMHEARPIPLLHVSSSLVSMRVSLDVDRWAGSNQRVACVCVSVGYKFNSLNM